MSIDIFVNEYVPVSMETQANVCACASLYVCLCALVTMSAFPLREGWVALFIDLSLKAAGEMTREGWGCLAYTLAGPAP